MRGPVTASTGDILTSKILEVIKKKQPSTWDMFLRTANKSDTETIFKKEKMFTLKEAIFKPWKIRIPHPLKVQREMEKHKASTMS